MTSRSIAPLLRKETRALLPTAVAANVAMLVNLVPHSWRIGDLTMLAYVFGSLALGAQSIGHEYSYRTLGTLLVQPSDRRRLWLAKFSVLAMMLLWVTATMWKIPSDRHDFDKAWSWYAPQMLFLSALFIAPWLTMLCRSSLAGMIFTGAMFWLLWGASAIFKIATVGMNSRTGHDSLKMAVWMMFGLCAIAAVSGWRGFVRLEATDGGGTEVTLPRWLRRSAASASEAVLPGGSQHPVWMLVKKELRLQQMTFVIAALYVLCWAAAGLMERYIPDFPVDFPLFPITILYFALLSIVIGSLASAEERQLGTLEWQVLMPMSIRHQWLVKVASVLGLSLVLGVGLPVALNYAHMSEDVRVQGTIWNGIFLARMIVTVVVLTAVGLYLSSVSTAGVRALALAVPVAFAAGTLVPYVTAKAPTMAYAIVTRLGRRPNTHGLYRISPNMYFRLWSSDIPLVIGAGFALLVLWLAMENHRSAERSLSRVSKHAMGFVAYLVAGTLALTAFEVLF